MRKKMKRITVGLTATLISAAGLLLTGCGDKSTEPIGGRIYRVEPMATKTPEPLGAFAQVSAIVEPPQETIPVHINVPQKAQTVAKENYIMRRGAEITQDASIVISVPSRKQPSAVNKEGGEEFSTDGPSSELEQHIEHNLLARGFVLKDRTKFEAKLRDLRESKGKGEELWDTAELIRAAQDGEVNADYILQVNRLDVTPYEGTPLALAPLQEIQAVTNAYPDLCVGGLPGKSIPKTIPQPWLQARFSVKLINAKTGTVDWLGEYAMGSASVLKDGVNISINVRRIPTNVGVLQDKVTAYNRQLSEAFVKVEDTRQKLEAANREAKESRIFEGRNCEQNGRKYEQEREKKVQQAKQVYTEALSAYEKVRKDVPPTPAWEYGYDVDAPVVSPDLISPVTEKDRQRLAEHVKELGFAITRDLIGTIDIKK